MYAKLNENAEVEAYPYWFADLVRDNPNVSFPAHLDDDTLADLDVVRVVVIGAPDHDPETEEVIEELPEWNAGRERWQQKFTVVPK